ncbi:hypothetical protein CGRA01v4_11451 [Colletotrichum graminicola]|nr:hypothetical protein CGRA01v4_11451 [Colletotrichum graminicola]
MMRASHCLPLARLRIIPYLLGQVVTTAAAIARSSSDVRIVPPPSLTSSGGGRPRSFYRCVARDQVVRVIWHGWSRARRIRSMASCGLTLHPAAVLCIVVSPTLGQGFR